MTSSNDSKYYFKVFAVLIALTGTKIEDIARCAGVSHVTISSWIKTVDEKGFEALKRKRFITRRIENLLEFPDNNRQGILGCI